MADPTRLTWREMGPRMARSGWFRLGITTALLGWVGSRLDWSKMEGRLAEGHPELFAAAVGIVVVTLTVGALRWARVLRVLDLSLTARRVGRVYAISSFSSTFLPTSVGGDVARALMVGRSGSRLTRALLSITIDRGAGLAGLLAVAWLAIALEPGTVPHGVRTGLIVATLGVALALALVLLLAFGTRGMGRRLPGRIRGVLVHARDGIRACLADRVLIAWLAVTSIAFQALVAAQTVVLANAINVELPFATAATAVALVSIATIMPISIAGFGIREASYVVVLGKAGISATDATLISLLSIATLFVASIPGALLLLTQGVSEEVPEGQSAVRP